jgi:hypothetical protein
MYLSNPDQMLNESSSIKGLTNSMDERLLFQAGLILYVYYPSSQQWEGKGNFQKITGEEALDLSHYSFERFIERIHPDDK